MAADPPPPPDDTPDSRPATDNGPPLNPCVRALREAMRLYAEAVLDRARAMPDGRVGAVDLLAIQAYLMRRDSNVEAYLDSLMVECREWQRAALMNELRGDTFHRLLVGLFEDRLTPRGELGRDDPERLPRQALPAFFQWAHGVLGAEFVTRQERACERAKGRLIEQAGMAFDWADLERQPEVVTILQETAYRLITHFGRNFRGKVATFITKMNYNLTETDRSFGLGRGYLINERRTRLLLSALIRPIDPEAMGPEARQTLARNLGEGKLAIIQRLKAEVASLDGGG
ncbi:hypothetical protein [Roseospirillum parvum]|uniref:Uncharacterized protein n=1 Tax=Roseospirillum parvum TaxID=83401 RepID=A0A1G8CJ69_9PROT|nr:hypothetical protein [Roseospirillum parvum]SDH45517.1 hypothetical protein SAMN05421742_10719 [Roseospirillum parvum]